MGSTEMFQNKRVKKCNQTLSIFLKAARIAGPSTEKVTKEGNLLIKVIEEAISKDKDLSNLKGKVKEIKNLMELILYHYYQLGNIVILKNEILGFIFNMTQ